MYANLPVQITSESSHAEPKTISTPDDDLISTSSTSSKSDKSSGISQPLKNPTQKSSAFSDVTSSRKPTNELADLLSKRQKKNNDPNALIEFESKVQQSTRERRRDHKSNSPGFAKVRNRGTMYCAIQNFEYQF